MMSCNCGFRCMSSTSRYSDYWTPSPTADSAVVTSRRKLIGSRTAAAGMFRASRDRAARARTGPPGLGLACSPAIRSYCASRLSPCAQTAASAVSTPELQLVTWPGSVRRRSEVRISNLQFYSFANPLYAALTANTRCGGARALCDKPVVAVGLGHRAVPALGVGLVLARSELRGTELQQFRSPTDGNEHVAIVIDSSPPFRWPRR
jgi:hypothetical protein